MSQETSTTQAKPRQGNYVGRWIAALVLGIVTWATVNWWLEPRPIWRLPASEDVRLSWLLCENDAGTWLAAERFESDDHAAFHILDANTGKTHYRLTKPERTSSIQNYFERQSIRMVGNILWRCTDAKVEQATRYELRAWHFTQEENERVVQQWLVPDGVPFDFIFDPQNSPHFMVRTELPWQPGLATLLADPWTGLTSILALQNANETWAATISIIPWIRTFELSSESPDLPRQLASWTLPALRWGKPNLGPDARWIIFGDSVLPPRWKNGTKFTKPLGVLLYNGHTGEKRELAGEAAEQAQPRKAVAWDNLIRICEVTDPLTFRWYYGDSGKAVSWPASLSAPFAFGKLYQDRLHANKSIYNKDGKNYHLELSAAGIRGFPVAMPENLDHVELKEPIYLQDNYQVYDSQVGYQPEFLVWLGSHSRWLMDKVNDFWPPIRPGVHFFDITTGKKVWQIAELDERHLVRPSKKHFYAARYWKGGATHEGWAIPFRFYSPWWGRGLGMGVFVVAVMVLTLLAYRQNAHRNSLATPSDLPT